MKNKTILDFLPINFRHEKSYMIQNKILDFESLSDLSDLDINNILKNYPLCTLNNLKKIRAMAIFKKQIKISPPEAYILLHCGVSSIKSLSQLKPYELEDKIGRLERKLRVKTESNISLPILKDWIERANKVLDSI